MTHTTTLRRGALAAIAAMLSLGLAACGQSTSSSSKGDSSDSGPTTAEAKTAQKFVDDNLAVPTTIHQTQELPEAPPKGKKIIWLNCDLPVCTTQGKGIEAAAEAVGWTYAQVNYKSADPATLTAAFKRALTENPDAVVQSGVPPEGGWSSVIPDYKKAGVPIVASYIATADADLPDGVVANVAGPAEFDQYAKQVANWFIADSNGEGKALIHRVDAYPILKSVADAMVKYIKEGCAKCDVSTVVQSSATDVAAQKVVPAIVSGLKRNPKLTYMLSADIEFLDALPSALAAAGLKDVKVAGQSPTIAGIGNVHSGKFAMSSTHASAQAGWLMTDAAIRAVMGIDVLKGDEYTTPTRILLPGGDYPTGRLIDEPEDYPAQFKKLWKVG